jgi:hypothetical protein
MDPGDLLLHTPGDQLTYPYRRLAARMHTARFERQALTHLRSAAASLIFRSTVADRYRVTVNV